MNRSRRILLWWFAILSVFLAIVCYDIASRTKFPFERDRKPTAGGDR